MKFLFTCGGTAGHVNPAIGLADRLRELIPDCEILFVGAEGNMEMRLVPMAGYEIKAVKISNVSRSLSLAGVKHNVNTLKYVILSTAEAKGIIRDFGADVVIGTGGYVCYPVLRAAKALGIPTLVHESNAVPGLTTRLLEGSVDRIMVGFEKAADNYKHKKKVLYTGTPVRGEFLKANRTEAKAKLGLPADKPLLVSVWGSLGCDHMNGIMERFAAIAAERGDFRVIHSAGRGRYDKLKKVLDESCPDCGKKGVDVRPYIYDMPAVMDAADLIMCRSGASTLAELRALGRAAILVPSPNVTNNHQEKNARALEAIGGARVHLEGEFTAESLYDEVCSLIHDRAKLDEMEKAMFCEDNILATERIAEIILGYAERAK